MMFVFVLFVEREFDVLAEIMRRCHVIDATILGGCYEHVYCCRILGKKVIYSSGIDYHIVAS